MFEILFSIIGFLIITVLVIIGGGFILISFLFGLFNFIAEIILTIWQVINNNWE